MSKAYKTNMNISLEGCTPNGGFLMYQVEKEVDERGFKERTGAEVFGFLAGAAINGANPKCSYDQLKNFRRVANDLKNASAKGEFISNKTDMDIIKNSIRGNPNWPNQDEIYLVLDQIITALDSAELITENPSDVPA